MDVLLVDEWTLHDKVFTTVILENKEKTVVQNIKHQPLEKEMLAIYI